MAELNLLQVEHVSRRLEESERQLQERVLKLEEQRIQLEEVSVCSEPRVLRSNLKLPVMQRLLLI